MCVGVVRKCFYLTIIRVLNSLSRLGLGLGIVWVHLSDQISARTDPCTNMCINKFKTTTNGRINQQCFPPIPNRSLLPQSSTKLIRAGCKPFVLLVPLPSTSLGKIEGLKGNKGKGRDHWWCWVALVAIVWWFEGHLTWFWWLMDELMAGCVTVCCKLC